MKKTHLVTAEWTLIQVGGHCSIEGSKDVLLAITQIPHVPDFGGNPAPVGSSIQVLLPESVCLWARARDGTETIVVDTPSLPLEGRYDLCPRGVVPSKRVDEPLDACLGGGIQDACTPAAPDASMRPLLLMLAVSEAARQCLEAAHRLRQASSGGITDDPAPRPESRAGGRSPSA